MKIFIVCSKKYKHLINYLNISALNLHNIVYYPSWYIDNGQENGDNLKKDISVIKDCDILFIIGGTLNLYNYIQIYEGYRNGKSIYSYGDNLKNNKLSNILGIDCVKIKDFYELPMSKFIELDRQIQLLYRIDENIKLSARNILCDLNKEPIVFVENDFIVFEWKSDPEKVDFCKYLIQFRILNNGYKLDIFYYDETVYSKENNNLELNIYRINKYLEDFETLSR